MNSDHVPRPKINLTDQMRRWIIEPQDLGVLAGGVPYDTGTLPVGAGLTGGAGYTRLMGIVEADQAFTVAIYQGATANIQSDVVTITALDPSGAGAYVVPLNVPLFGDWVRIVITNTTGVDTTYLRTSAFAIPAGPDLPGYYIEYPRYVTLVGGIGTLTPYTHDAAAPATGIMAGGRYLPVKTAVGDGDASHISVNAYGDLEIAGYSRILDAIKVVEQAPAIYDLSSGTAKASVALPAAGAFDTPTEIPVAGFRFLKIWVSYTRGAANGGVAVRPETCDTVGGVDQWGQDVVVNTGAFAAGAWVTSGVQMEDFYYQEQATAGAEVFTMSFDLQRAHKFRVSVAEAGVVGTPGTVAIYYLLSN